MNERSIQPSRSAKIIKAACLTLCAIGLVTAASAAWIPMEAQLKQRELEQVYEQGVEQGAMAKPWVSSDLEVAGKLVYPRLRQSAVILANGTEEALRAGPSLVPGTAKIGEAGTSVITAHRETHFAFLKRARIGDIVQAAGNDGVMRSYRVTDREIVEADEFAIAVGISKNRLALYTCYPFNSARLTNKRFVVHAELLE